MSLLYGSALAGEMERIAKDVARGKGSGRWGRVWGEEGSLGLGGPHLT